MSRDRCHPYFRRSLQMWGIIHIYIAPHPFKVHLFPQDHLLQLSDIIREKQQNTPCDLIQNPMLILTFVTRRYDLDSIEGKDKIRSPDRTDLTNSITGILRPLLVFSSPTLFPPLSTGVFFSVHSFFSLQKSTRISIINY